MRSVSYPYPRKAGAFTGTLTGFSTNPTGTVNYTVTGSGANAVAHLTILANITNTSNATTMTMTGLPADCQPISGTPYTIGYPAENNGTSGLATIAFISGSTITFYLMSGTPLTFQAWTASGTKGLLTGWSIAYPLN
jgi:hypothetical protein